MASLAVRRANTAAADTASKKQYCAITIIFSCEYIMANKSRRVSRRTRRKVKHLKKSRGGRRSRGGRHPRRRRRSRGRRAVKRTHRHRRRQGGKRRKTQRGGSAEAAHNIHLDKIGSLLDLDTSMITLSDDQIHSYVSAGSEPLGIDGILDTGKRYKVRRPIQCVQSHLE